MSKDGQKNIVAVIGITIALALGFGVTLALGGRSATTPWGVDLVTLCVCVAFGVQWLMFIPAYAFKTERYFDATGSLTYITLVVVALALGAADDRSLLLGAMVLAWALRLGSFLFVRVSKAGEDRRFRTMKHHFMEFLMTWTLQGLWVVMTLAAALAVMTSDQAVPLDRYALLGGVLWALGWTMEIVADRQKTAFRAKPENRDAFIAEGLWARSRHPNYVGEILLWIGIAIIAFPALEGSQHWALISPLFVYVLLVHVSGVRMLENGANKRWGDDPVYQAYKSATPVLWPRLRAHSK